MQEVTQEIEPSHDGNTEPLPKKMSTNERLFELLNRQIESGERLHTLQSDERRAATAATVGAIDGLREEMRRLIFISLGAVCLLAVVLTGGRFAAEAFGVKVDAEKTATEAVTGAIDTALKGGS